MFNRKFLWLCGLLGLFASATALLVTSQPSLKNRFLTSPLGKYAFTVSDDAGNKVAEGKIVVTDFEYEGIQGKWQLRYFENNSRGFDRRSGETKETPFAGAVHGNEVKIHLNLYIADANNVLQGTLMNNVMRGDYLFCGFAGCNNIGKFEAIRK